MCMVFGWCVQFQLVALCRLFPSLQAERECTAGDGWFNLPATPITPELRSDLKVLRMRSAIDPQRHYKKADSRELPKFFQVQNYSLDSTSLLVWPARPNFPFGRNAMLGLAGQTSSPCIIITSLPCPLTLLPTYVGWSCGWWSFGLLLWQNTKEATPKYLCGGAHG